MYLNDYRLASSNIMRRWINGSHHEDEKKETVQKKHEEYRKLKQNNYIEFN